MQIFKIKHDGETNVGVVEKKAMFILIIEVHVLIIVLFSWCSTYILRLCLCSCKELYYLPGSRVAPPANRERTNNNGRKNNGKQIEICSNMPFLLPPPSFSCQTLHKQHFCNSVVTQIVWISFRKLELKESITW